jgi:hypothetical protein
MKNKIILSVWHFDGGPEEIAIPLPGLNISKITCIYPNSSPIIFNQQLKESAVTVMIPVRSARIFELILN